MKMIHENKTNEKKLREIKGCINKKDSLYCIPKNESEDFERDSRREGKGTLPIMTYGDYIVYLKAERFSSSKNSVVEIQLHLRNI